MKTIVISADDKVGLLADISYLLAKAKINIETICVDVFSGRAVISLEVTDPVKGKQVVEAGGYKVEDLNAVVIKINEKDLSKVTKQLTDEGLKVQNVQVLAKDNHEMVYSMVVDKPKRANTLLQPHLITNKSYY
ncbi:hypothetical protein H0O00_03515 [Candidatus Micrarchaeota archaeon]|nr:hypothetical protein [Candidatus Micrarchaeota archaeon]